jgi:hypothetical protein
VSGCCAARKPAARRKINNTLDFFIYI